VRLDEALFLDYEGGHPRRIFSSLPCLPSCSLGDRFSPKTNAELPSVWRFLLGLQVAAARNATSVRRFDLGRRIVDAR